MTGSAVLAHALGRTGHAALTYNRGVQLVQGFSAPVLSNSITANVMVQPFSHAQIFSAVRYFTGVVGTGEGDNAYRALIGQTGVNVRITRTTTMYTSYSYYEHKIGNDVELIARTTHAQSRHSLRVGISTQLWLMQGPRRGKG